MLLPKVQDFTEFSKERINAYYGKKVLNSKPVEQVELEQIISRAAALHEDLRNYGNLGDTGWSVKAEWTSWTKRISLNITLLKE